MNHLKLAVRSNAVINHMNMNMNMSRTSSHFHRNSNNAHANANAVRIRIQPMLTSAMPEPQHEHDEDDDDDDNDNNDNVQGQGQVQYNNNNRVRNETASWQPYKNVDIQRVTQTAIIHEITHQQSQTIAKVVPWFLANMPSSYFNTVPEEFRLDHMKAVSAIQDANMDLHLNLKTHLPDGRLVLTYIRPGKADQTAARKGATGRILNLVKDLPWNHNAVDYLPLSRVQVFNSEDHSMSISIFVFGEEGGSASASASASKNVEGAIMDASASVLSSSTTFSPLLSSTSSSSSETIGSRILDYAHHLQSGEFAENVNVNDNNNDDDNHADNDNRNPLPNHIFEKEELLAYFEKCPETYIVRSDPRRFLKQRELYEKVTGTECMAVSVEKSWVEHSAGDFWVDIAVANSLPQVALENASMVLSRNNFDIVRAHLDILSDDDNGDVCMLRLLVERHDHHDNDDPSTSDSITSSTSSTSDSINQVEDISVLDPILLELKRTKWMDPYAMELVFHRYPWLSLRRGEVITGLCSLLHPIMSKKDAFAFSLGNIFDMMTNKRYIQHASSIADLFLDRFRPSNPLSDEDFDERKGDLMTKIMTDVEDTMAKDLLIKMIEIVSHTLRTNIYLENRYALGLRLDPNVMHSDNADDKEVPYGVIFVHGRRFNSFHVRFKDIARGGMRLVTPTSQESHALESARQYDECYGLAYAQQLKNKDIPEGGSKAVNLINCDELSGDAKQFVMRKSVKAFTNTIFDLIVETDETRQRVVDRLGKSEVLYLGPDEQVTVEDINWIVKRAKNRGYAIPNAFMSSKPASGINHKEFGVTSEGVNMYLDVALRNVLDIDPTKDKFTVKITGGPDGDVAGNEIKILFREYGDNVKIVGIADGSGCAEDPDGLDHEELVRLVDNTLSISQFNWSKLGPKGELHAVDDNEEGIKARNSMHNRLVADAFIPAGGRPNTIDMSNYKNFLLPDGSPSSRLIVEGANLFITGDARQALYDEAGVAIIKDSSANKAGVITSSYEICSAMLLSEEDFASNKPQIVSEVLEKLRGFARAEAELLFSEYESHPDALPMISQRISNTINTATDAISKELDGLTANEVDDLLPLFRDHLPNTISDLAFHEVHSKVPPQYIRNAIASCLASKLVYKEGCAYIQSLNNQDNLASLAIEYIAKEREMEVLKKALEGCNDMADTERLAIIKILEAGGTRTALDLNK